MTHDSWRNTTHQWRTCWRTWGTSVEWTLGQLPMTTFLINELLAHCGIKAFPVTILNLYFELYLCITFVNFNFEL